TAPSSGLRRAARRRQDRSRACSSRPSGCRSRTAEKAILHRMQIPAQERAAALAPEDAADLRMCREVRLNAFAEIFQQKLPTDVFELRRQLAVLRKQSRSEEHTSELQSRVDLVCRLLL